MNDYIANDIQICKASGFIQPPGWPYTAAPPKKVTNSRRPTSIGFAPYDLIRPPPAIARDGAGKSAIST